MMEEYKILKDDLLHYIFLLQHLIKEQFLEYHKYKDQNKTFALQIIENQKLLYKKYNCTVNKLRYDYYSLQVFHVEIKDWLLSKEGEVSK